MVKPDGQATGFAVEVMQAAVHAVGREVVFETGPWSEVKSRLEAGSLEALPLVGRTPEREAAFDFTFPYLTLHGAIAIRRGTQGIQTLADLKGRSVAVMKGDNAEEFLRRNDPGCHIRETATFVEALRELEEGKHDAVVLQRLLALRLIQEHRFQQVELVAAPITGFRQDFCFAVKEGNRELLALLNEGLALIMADGTFRRLHARWMGALDTLSHRRIIVGGDQHYPPWEFLTESGEPTGFNVDLIRAIAREMGVEVEIKLGPWPDIMRALEQGEIDMIQGMFYSPQRDERFDFSNAHTVNSYIAVVRRDFGVPPSEAREFGKHRIALERGDFIDAWAVEHGLNENIIRVDNQESAIRAVLNGNADCALVGRLTAQYLIKKYGWTNLVCGQKPLISPEYCFAFRNGQIALTGLFNEGLSMVEKTGEYRKINEKWFGVQEQKHDSLSAFGRLLAMAAVPLLVVFLISAAWTRTLKRQVAVRTAELRDSEARHRRLFETMAQGVVYQAADGRIISANPSAERILGLTLDQMMGRTSMDPCWRSIREDGSDLPGSEHPAMIALRTGQPVGPHIMGVARPDEPNHRWLRVSARPLFRPGEEKPYQVYATLEDITEIRQAREEYQQLFRLMMNGFLRGEIVRNPDGQAVDFRFLAVNPAFERLTGLKAETTIGRAAREVIPDLEHSWLDIYERVVTTGEPVQFENASRALNKTFDVSAFRTGPNQFAAMFFDITERRRAEEERAQLHEQLLQAQKMESVGRLAGGIAHDFNNILGVILGRLELVMEDLGENHPQRHSLLEIERAAQRSAELTRQLLAFARKQTAMPQVIQLGNIVDGMLSMLARLLGENIRIEWKPAQDLWHIRIDPVQMDQILVNLSVNARDAIKGTGVIVITAENVTVKQDTTDRLLGTAPGDYVRLGFRDDGCGMPPHVKDKLFEPFFTTKDVGKGTGLGLATVYGIMKQNGGYIEVQSEIGKGTTFRLYFPRHDAGPDAAVSNDAALSFSKRPSGATNSSGQTILLCEDRADIRDLTSLMLERCGYRVLSASSPGEALAFVQDRASEISLLITDIIMPDMDGRELARKVTAVNPRIRCLFMSGYTADVISSQEDLDEGMTFIQKPFTSVHLVGKVRELLEG